MNIRRLVSNSLTLSVTAQPSFSGDVKLGDQSSQLRHLDSGIDQLSFVADLDVAVSQVRGALS